MKKILLFVFFFAISSVGQNIVTKKVKSTVLNQKREILIYEPVEMSIKPESRFEVIYVFDAQSRNYFDFVHSSAQFIKGQHKAFIIVGIISPLDEAKKQSRNTDFLPVAQHPETKADYQGYSGGADKFMHFLNEEIFPFIEKEYRVFPERIAIGHSNGGTFITYCLLNQPEMFNAYIAVSPNLAYDRGQLINELQKLDPNTIPGQKYFYMSRANEGSDNGFNDWNIAYDKAIAIMEKPGFSKKIKFISEDFSQSQSHYSTFPFGTLSGLNAYLNYRFYNAENGIAYYEDLNKKGLLNLTADFLSKYAYDCFEKNQKDNALAIMDYTISKHPADHALYNLKAEFYELSGDNRQASQWYKKALDVLNSQRAGYNEILYNEVFKLYDRNYKRAVSKIK